jgi:riboflavin kinase/FMN adenylyltransferase
MQIIRGLESFPPEQGPSVVALGVFDGIHLAHRAILGQAVGRARATGQRAVACTFDPHPAEVLQPGRAPLPISTLEERLALIAGTGIDTALIITFTKQIAAVEPEAFVADVLLGRLRATEIVVGFNHTFGRGARGDARLLETLAGRLGFRAHTIPPLEVDGVPVSSSGIRAALQRGDVETAARLLDRPYAIGGEIVAGAGRGRTLGFPTANIAADRPLLVPTGVYACRIEIGAEHQPAVVNIGVRPTFEERALTVEAHLLDFSGDLYGRQVRLAFVRRLREERKFPDVAALREQIARDVAAAREVVGR